jgi:pSer/pThr/pTyr-binding forkhead associated (FHA) protein
MIDVTLTYPTPDGTQEIPVSGAKLTFGRGSEADQRFADDGLSRLHATVYREGDRLWVVDENSSNGTFVNGQPVRPGGTPLVNGDKIKIGHTTVLTVRVTEAKQAATPKNAASVTTVSASSEQKPVSMIPVALVAIALLVFSVTAVFVGFKVFGGNKSVVVRNDDPDDIDIEPTKDPKASPSVKPVNSTGNTGTTQDNTSITDSPESDPTSTVPSLPPGKKYLDLSDGERRQYIGAHAMKIAQIIGNRSSEEIPAAAIDKIKVFADAYAKRAGVKPLGGCRFGDNLQVTYERASRNAPFIVRAFNEKGTDPRIGLYLAMIESEHCVCLQSPTGPLGMFQFTFATAKLHFEPSEGVIKGASPPNGDDRCKPEPSARAAASYMKALTGRYGTGPSSVPLAIGSYNSGEGGLSSNLVKALESNAGLPRDFWTLIANGDKLSKQFQSENFKYVPKFFAAAIIGENPQDFGLNLQPISTYTK